ncbi:MAG: carboxymuconolactone decarboxylase family protein, partial [Aeromicrobium sp.]|nr:carboxymuconolactone decarboxylase family protein [Burkholderiales bacterium]
LTQEGLQSPAQINDAELAEARSAGLSDAQIVDVVASVAVNVLTNYLNNLAGTAIDFPRVDL